MADHSVRIAQIETILRNGVRSVTNDGTTIHYDFNALRKELRELRAADDANKGRRPQFVDIKLGGL